MKVYGSQLCPDVRAAVEVLMSKDVAFDFIDITADL